MRTESGKPDNPADSFSVRGRLLLDGRMTLGVVIVKNGRIAALCNIEEERRSNRSFMELETVGATERFSVSIRGLGCEVATFPGGRSKLVIPDNIEVRDLYVIAAEQGVQIRRMNQRRDSLEDIFLRAMDNDQDSTDNHPKRTANVRL